MRSSLEIRLLNIINDQASEASAQKLDAIQQYFLQIIKPKVFGLNKDSILIYNDVNFEKVCCALEDNGTVNAKNLTVFEFFTRSQYCEGKFKNKQ